jgi:hypothetical protein
MPKMSTSLQIAANLDSFNLAWDKREQVTHAHGTT